MYKLQNADMVLKSRKWSLLNCQQKWEAKLLVGITGLQILTSTEDTNKKCNIKLVTFLAWCILEL